MKNKERLVIKNFGPIVEADIEIKPFMVFIGESGSGKSVILKTLGFCRWICKKVSLASIIAHIEPRYKRNRNIYNSVYKREIREIQNKIYSLMIYSGLSDYLVVNYLNESSNTVIQYYASSFELTIRGVDGSLKLEFLEQLNIPNEDIFLEKNYLYF